MAEAERLLLTIDTSSEQAGVGLFGPGIAAELTWLAGRTQTVSLLAQVHALLHLHGKAPADLGAVAVATGPGTFTGVRVGLSIAKGLVLALDCLLVGIDTLDIAAYPVADGGGAPVAAVAAGRGRVVWARFEAGLPLRRRGDARNSAVADLAEWFADHPGATLVGELPADFDRSLPNGAAVVVDPLLRGRRPAALARLARARLGSGDVDDPAELEPRYVGR